MNSLHSDVNEGIKKASTPLYLLSSEIVSLVEADRRKVEELAEVGQ